ncbi:GNAT family N-acetyltransferase [Streptomyces marincola]|uniref:GNAT family N-acetyltransferase n=1 Tax=Streptomyces marincola TaxID=2878388 RepID=UPI000D1BC1FC|nr:GNAT family N-acetyltransferase [Streptomyces marincola]
MTTTLRPAGPGEPLSGEPGSAQTFDIRVNGRRVGGLRLLVRGTGRDAEGEISGLMVDPDERRRGRATVALLAAEEVLRSRGCLRADAVVPARAHGALALAGALGWSERVRGLVKHLTGPPPPLPPGLAVRAAGAGGLRLVTREGAGTGHVGELRVSRPPAGAAPAGADVSVSTLRVAEEHRRRGYGRALLHEAERVCLAAGGHVVGATVPCRAAEALRLLASLGYEAAEFHLSKPLG